MATTPTTSVVIEMPKDGPKTALGVRAITPNKTSGAGTYVLDTFKISLYRTVDYYIRVSQPGTSFMALHFILVHDGREVKFDQYGRVQTGTTPDMEMDPDFNLCQVYFYAVIEGEYLKVIYTQPSRETLVTAWATGIGV